jgi:hypothetical protein
VGFAFALAFLGKAARGAGLSPSVDFLDAVIVTCFLEQTLHSPTEMGRRS